MNLEEFLFEVDGKETDIISYTSEMKALQPVKRNGYALRYVDKKVFNNAV